MPCTQDIPDNIAAHLVQQVGDVDAGDGTLRRTGWNST